MPVNKLSDEEQAEIDAFDAEIERARIHASHAKALSRELLIILVIDLLLIVVPFLLSYIHMERAGEITLYVIIVGTVLAAGGLWRSSFGWFMPEWGKNFVLYGLLFAMALVFYCILYFFVVAWNPENLVDPQTQLRRK